MSQDKVIFNLCPYRRTHRPQPTSGPRDRRRNGRICQRCIQCWRFDYACSFQEPRRRHGPASLLGSEIGAAICDAIREACPGVIINMSTGVIGNDISEQVACLKRIKPEIAACNAGSLNYLKTRRDGSWAWPPMIFDNPVDKVQAFAEAMKETNTVPEFECFDVGILRSVKLYMENGFAPQLPDTNLVMGVASGMPADPRLLEILVDYLVEGTSWQTTVIGRQDVWPVHQRTAELGGNLRTGVEDTFYLPNGDKTSGNGELIEHLAQCAANAGRAIASPEEARAMLHLGA